MWEWKNRHGQNCRAGKCRSGKLGTVIQALENAGVKFAGVLSSLYLCTYMSRSNLPLPLFDLDL